MQARAGWLYFIAGNTQDEIARKLNISRPAAQRLVSLALEKRLITFRLEHPIAACMELSRRLIDRYELRLCDVVPTDPEHPDGVAGVAASAAAYLEQILVTKTPLVIALGTGRTLRAAVDQIRRWSVRSTGWFPWSATSRRTDRQAFSTRSPASPISPRPRIIHSRCR
jgi:DNA-binding transcriptional regulator LsrR (DeoR family)